MPDKVRLLFLGDLIGRPGRQAMRRLLPGLISQYDPTVVMANGENAAGGVGLTEKVAQELFEYFDVITTGNHIWDKKEILPMLDKTNRILRPANYPPENPGQGTTVIPDKNGYPVAVLNLQGRVFMEPIDCPFRRADEEIARLREKTPIIIVDFHAEATSEKQAMGWYLDGRVSAVLGTHTHVPTADGRVLPQGTAFVTDVGMVGGRDSIIGVKREQALQRFLSGRPQRFEPAKGRLVLMAAYVEIDSLSGRALTIKTEVIEEESEAS
ncbi:MAG: TIGR00282 family metallophosphoesterase [Candidatus Aminicenantes bacterium]|nr:MAG: TIGR00282 family metallophosphoesterase [Candidatus Aminicenantes bacterium]RLE04202.1 MAG: TIGR00282 family metallophosphoesterase [Candidatus Aminicenantes bacterium]